MNRTETSKNSVYTPFFAADLVSQSETASRVGEAAKRFFLGQFLIGTYPVDRRLAFGNVNRIRCSVCDPGDAKRLPPGSRIGIAFDDK